MPKLSEMFRIYSDERVPEGVALIASAGPEIDPEILTASGHMYNFDEPDPNIISLIDIATGLSNACRFAGQLRRDTTKFCSVAEHSVRVAHILRAQGHSPDIQKVGLLHDAHEAYVWDCPRPLKPLLGDAFEHYARVADETIFHAIFGTIVGPIALQFLGDPRVKAADDIALCYEAHNLMANEGKHVTERYPDVPDLPDGVEIHRPGLPPVVAKGMFLNECQELGLL